MSTLPAASAQRLYRLIADQIASKIAAGDFTPGERLPSERELAEQLNVARSTLREALIALEISGYIEVRVGSGVFVVDGQPRAAANDSKLADADPAAPADPADTLAALAASRVASPFDLLETRMLIEPECAALAAQHGTDEQLAAIQQAYRQMNPEQAGKSHHLVHDQLFHQAIAAASGNAALASVVTHVWNLSSTNPLYRQLGKHFVDASVWRLAMEEHGRIVAAIVGRNPIRARHAMLQHLLAISARLSEDIVA